MPTAADMGATAAQKQQQAGRVLVPSVATNILISGIGVSCGTTVTNPIGKQLRYACWPDYSSIETGMSEVSPGTLYDGT